jgi:translation initiation factor IF-1
VRIVYGDLDSVRVLEEESAKADIIYRMDPLGPEHTQLTS